MRYILRISEFKKSNDECVFTTSITYNTMEETLKKIEELHNQLSTEFHTFTYTITQVVAD